MAQSSTCSFVLPLKFSHPNQGGGSVTQLQHPVKRIQNRIYRNGLKNPLRERKAIIRYKFSESEYPTEVPKDENVHGSIQKIDIWKQLNSLYKFSRPYVVVNTLVAIPSISLLPLESTADLSLSFFVGLFQALVPSVMMNLYAVGLNQLTDIDIDKVNKPYLALPSGEISTELGIAVTSAYLLMSFTMGIMFQSPPLLSALLVRFLMLTAYSVQVLNFLDSFILKLSSVTSQGQNQKNHGITNNNTTTTKQQGRLIAKK
ncbi:hypothetical protein Vadar_005881 [Vaccinium darrowii]|uniref:Uncharacterized protein n=1 Tax=Vaccinium darrowii TaxID=229202 RepID=A0ACB7YUB7_9ERIC|nr:hypothetical protein Vadar_005881 [Vaccinium darrowii]